jgi:hypothetical protein
VERWQRWAAEVRAAEAYGAGAGAGAKFTVTAS